MLCLCAASNAAAAVPSPLGLTCSTGGASYYQCGSDGANTANTPTTANTWDGMPIDVSVALPDPGTFGNGPYPLVMMFHGYGQGKLSFANMATYTSKGYAVFTMTDRGFYGSCGSQASVNANPIACEGQYPRLMDDRYEVRDAQFFAGGLVDDGLAQPTRIASTGASYGGGMSMALAALKDRTMLPDGRLVPWKSPAGTPLSLAVATPLAPWTDIAYGLTPNGRVLDYLRENPYDATHIGVMKESIQNGLFLSGQAAGRYAPAGTLPNGDFIGWLNTLDAGEPYQSQATNSMVAELTTYHSSYYINHSQAPAPTLIAQGLTDDIFPVDEALRYTNRTRAQYPNADIGTFVGDFGHQRAQNKSVVSSAYAALAQKWIDYYLTGAGTKPATNVIAYTETCPNAVADGGPYTAPNWASLAPGEITVEGGAADQTISPDGGDPTVADAFGVIKNKACANPSSAKEAGSANYDSSAAPTPGYTLLGSPTVVADFEGAGQNSEIAARLLDVAPDGTEQLVTRQLYRPNASGYQVFQLHPGAWRFDSGHVARLQLLPKDATTAAAPLNLTNYGRPSDDQRAITVHDLVLRLPVTESPGALSGLVKAPAPKILPDDRAEVDLEPDYNAYGSETMAQWAASRPATPNPSPAILKASGPIKVSQTKVTVKVSCPASAASCPKAQVLIRANRKKGQEGAKTLVALKEAVSLAPGKSRKLKIGMTGPARNLILPQKVVKHRNGKKVVTKTKGLKKMPVTVAISSTAGRKVSDFTLKR